MTSRAKLLTVAAGSLLATLGVANAADADPVVDFFHRLGDSISHAGKRPPQPRKTVSNTSGKKRTKNDSAAAESPAPAQSPGSIASPTPVEPPTPTPVVVRRGATVASAVRGDLPYAVPVPNKPGFVTSPFAPGQGLVDIRGIPPGTEVKDPFTGKTFLTP